MHQHPNPLKKNLIIFVLFKKTQLFIAKLECKKSPKFSVLAFERGKILKSTAKIETHVSK